MRAGDNIIESIGFSSNATNLLYKVKDEKNKLTIEGVNEYDIYTKVERMVASEKASLYSVITCCVGIEVRTLNGHELG